MRTWLKWLNVVWLWAMVPALYAGNTSREVLNLNPSWKYSRGMMPGQRGLHTMIPLGSVSGCPIPSAFLIL